MVFDNTPLSSISLIDNSRYDYKDFEVTAENYHAEKMYDCENSHVGAEPALLVDSLSYDPSSARFAAAGIVVYVCPTCHQPAMQVE